MLTSIFSKFLIYVLSVLFTIGIISVAQAQDTIRIVTVNPSRILQESASMKISETEMEIEFSKRAKDLQEMEKKLKSISNSHDKNDKSFLKKDERKKQSYYLEQLKADFQIKQSKFYEDLNQRRNEELTKMFDKIYKAIKQLAEQQNYDLVVQEAIYASPRIDITDKVIKILSSSSVK